MRVNPCPGAAALAASLASMLLVISATGAGAQLPAAATTPVSFGFESDLNSRYVWRGIPQSEGNVVQSSVWTSFSSVTLTLWGNYDPATTGGRGFNEWDLYLGWEGEWAGLELASTANIYLYPHGEAPNTTEFEFGLVWPLAGGLAATLRQTADVSYYRGAAFTTAGFALERRIGEEMSLLATAELGYGSADFTHAYLDESLGALRLASAGLDVTVPLRTGWYLRPHLGYADLLGEQARDVLGDRTRVVFGCAAGREF